MESNVQSGGLRLFICDDGSRGPVCSAVRISDLHCDFIPAGESSLFEKSLKTSYVSLAQPRFLKPLSKINALLLQIGKLAELAFEEEQYNHNLQPDCSNDGSNSRYAPSRRRGKKPMQHV